MTTNEASASLEERVARLETAEEVRNLASAYARACDTKDLDLMRTLCAADVVISVGEQSWSGQDAAIEFYRAAWGANPNPSRHFMTNIATSRLTPDSAAATSYFYYVTVVDGRSMIAWGAYADTFVREGGRLVFSSKQIDMPVFVDLAAGWGDVFVAAGTAAGSGT